MIGKSIRTKRNMVKICLGRGISVLVESDEDLGIVQRKAEDMARKIVKKDIFDTVYIG